MIADFLITDRRIRFEETAHPPTCSRRLLVHLDRFHPGGSRRPSPAQAPIVLGRTPSTIERQAAQLARLGTRRLRSWACSTDGRV